ncbi:hypothetical protein HHI36_008145 [Cryptolaemus montrouzieri]|uniref:CS domain-containing protein n=1 Tax=Cryptolaemus montrouzieri TaxID=559131 RepID=A0ABD2MS64_9CUCU
MTKDIKKADIAVICEETNIEVKYKDYSLLKGALFSEINKGLINFSVIKNLLEINLVKEVKGIIWSTLFRNCNDYSNEFYSGNEVKNRLVYLSSEIEIDLEHLSAPDWLNNASIARRAT